MKKEEISKRIEEIENELKQLRNKLQDEYKYFDLEKLQGNRFGEVFSCGSSVSAGFDNEQFLAVRKVGEFKNKSFYLSHRYNWELTKDSEGGLCLIPTKK